MTWKTHLRISDYNQEVAILLGDVRDDGSVAAIEGPVTLRHVDNRTIVPSDTAFMTLPYNEAKQFLQAIVDAAWDFGVRPSDHARENGAQQKHLADMRKLVGKAHGVDL